VPGKRIDKRQHNEELLELLDGFGIVKNTKVKT
jgi:hypothetical protein